MEHAQESIRLREAVILAGGLGTRLRAAVPDLPKCMATVNGKPFLYYVLNYFSKQGIEHFIVSLGYRAELVQDYLQGLPTDYKITTVVENSPLGTGGAIRLAAEKAMDKNILILNGDTLFRIDLDSLARQHQQTGAIATLALKPMTHFDRYGVVETDPRGIVTQFKEKKPYLEGNINGGVYALDRERFLAKEWPEVFSFETAFLEKAYYPPGNISGLVQEAYFIDIGIPEDFERARRELAE